MKKKSPKHKVGDVVKTKHGNGTIEKVTRYFKEIDRFGEFDDHGLVTDEEHIGKGCLPFRFDGETLEVDFPESDYGTIIVKAKTMVSKFYSYGYSVRREDDRYFFAQYEHQIKKIKPTP